MPTTSCPGLPGVKVLVDGALSADEEASMTDHLERCEVCREALVQADAGDSLWSGLTRHLGTKRPQVESALLAVLNHATAQPPWLETPGDEPRDSGEFTLDFLDPPAEAGHLGRLGDYEVHEVIGRGGMGVVLKAFDAGLHRHRRHQGAGRQTGHQRRRPQAFPPRGPGGGRRQPRARRHHPRRRRGQRTCPTWSCSTSPACRCRSGSTGAGRCRWRRSCASACRRRRGWRRPTRRGWSTATSSRPTSCWKTASSGSRSPTSAWPAPVDDASLTQSGRRRRHAAVHGPGAGPRRAGRSPRRPVQPGQRAVRDVYRPAAVSGGQPPRRVAVRHR